MKLIKNIVDKLGSDEKDVYYVSSNGEIFETIPSRNFFRDNYNDLSVEFDYHVNFENNDNDFLPFKIKLLIKDRELINLNIEVKFSGSEMSGKLSSKYKFELPKNFSFLISNV